MFFVVFLVVKFVYKNKYRVLTLICQQINRVLFYIFSCQSRKVDISMNPYEKIKELTKQNGISVRELEKRLGYSNGYFSKWKSVSPNSEGLAKVSDYFGVSIDYLLGREERETPKFVDLSEDDTVFSFDGKEISKETMRKAIAIAKALEENE